MRVHCRVYGTVQGVGFRWFVRRAAQRLDLAGYILNHPDGSVELETDGPDDRVADLIRTVEHGPPGAQVENVQTLETTQEPLEKPFGIRR